MSSSDKFVEHGYDEASDDLKQMMVIIDMVSTTIPQIKSELRLLGMTPSVKCFRHALYNVIGNLASADHFGIQHSIQPPPKQVLEYIHGVVKALTNAYRKEVYPNGDYSSDRLDDGGLDFVPKPSAN